MEREYAASRIIYETVVGSRAYGINLDETADYDKSGVMIPGIEYFYGFDRFEQFMDWPEKDRVTYDIRKILKLISDNNPNCMDLLWVPDRCVVKTTPYWERIKEQRELFLSKRCRHTFAGYAFAQLQRIKTHRKFLLNPPTVEPTREIYGLPAVSIFPTAQLKAIVYATLEDFLIPEEKENFLSELDDIYGDYIMPLFHTYIQPDKRILAIEYLQIGMKSQANSLRSLGPSYIKDEYLDMAEKELKYYHAKKEWDQFISWKEHRNKARAGLEIKIGYDAKHAGHLIRLYRMGQEILETGKVNVDRTGIDAEEIKEIRQGSWKFEQVEEYANSMDKILDKAYAESKLQRSPQLDKIKELCIDTVKWYLADKELGL